MASTTYLPAPLTNVESIDDLKKWLDNEMELLALNARAQDISALKQVDITQGETIAQHTIAIEGLEGRMTTAEGTLTEVSATLTSERLFRISGDEALALQITTLQASLNDVSARVSTISEAFATELGAQAQLTFSVQAELTDLSASTTLALGAKVDTSTAYAWATLTLNVNDYVSGWTTVNDGNSADFTFLVDNLKVAKAGVSGGTAKTFLQVGTNQDGTPSITIKADVIEAESIITGGIEPGATSATTASTSAGGSDLGDAGDVHISHTKTLIGNEAGEATVLLTFTGTYNCARDPYDSRDVLGLGISHGSGTVAEHYIYPVEGGGDSIINTTTNFTLILEGLATGSNTFEIYTIATPTNNSGSTDARYAAETCTGSNFTLVATELKR